MSWRPADGLHGAPSEPAGASATASAEAIAEADLRACREQLRGGSRTFLAASYLLPRRVREPACALYAYCRRADDLIDGADPAPGVREDVLVTLERQLQALAAGRPGASLAERAMAAVMRRHRIPVALPAALLDGFGWDVAGRQYETIDALEAYAARVAGTVGAMMSLLMGVRDAAALARACDLGVAMQLSNIARDVGEDARMGRLYLPRAWLREAGLDPDVWLAAPVHSPALGAVVARLLARADELYGRVGDGIAALPLDCRPGITAAGRLYAAIGHEVARRGLDAVTGRAVVPPHRKLARLLPSLLAWIPRRAGMPMPPLAATRFLVEAVVQADRAALAAPAAAAAAPQWWAFGERWGRVLATFQRLSVQDRGA